MCVYGATIAKVQIFLEMAKYIWKKCVFFTFVLLQRKIILTLSVK